MVAQRLTPTLFDKLVADVELSGLKNNEGAMPQVMQESLRTYAVPRLDRFNEAALRATIRRDLAWLLNTTQYGALGSLKDYPEVQTSVINYGVPDLAGKSLHGRTILDRAREIRHAVRTFETRLEPDSLVIEPIKSKDSNSIGFLIHGDIRSALRTMPVQFRTELDAETASVSVGE